MPDRQAFAPAKAKACKDCPWRTTNLKRKPDPHGFYTLANLRRLWRGLRNGERMTCHPTDPEMAEFAGYEKTAERPVTYECAGALVLIQREMERFQSCAKEAEAEGQKDGLKRYRRKYPKGLTRDGLLRFFNDMMFGGTPLSPRDKMATPNLNMAGIGHPDLEPWEGK